MLRSRYPSNAVRINRKGPRNAKSVKRSNISRKKSMKGVQNQSQQALLQKVLEGLKKAAGSFTNGSAATDPTARLVQVSNGVKMCRYAMANKHCPYSPNCRFSHPTTSAPLVPSYKAVVQQQKLKELAGWQPPAQGAQQYLQPAASAAWHPQAQPGQKASQQPSPQSQWPQYSNQLQPGVLADWHLQAQPGQKVAQQPSPQSNWPQYSSQYPGHQGPWHQVPATKVNFANGSRVPRLPVFGSSQGECYQFRETGKCSYGHKCKYYHNGAKPQVEQEPKGWNDWCDGFSKMVAAAGSSSQQAAVPRCRDWSRGTCTRNHCKFAHC